MRKRHFSEGFVYQNKQAVTLEKEEFPQVSQFITQMLGTVNNLYVNRIEVSPRDRKEVSPSLCPSLLFDHDSPFKIKGPKYFAGIVVSGC